MWDAIQSNTRRSRWLIAVMGLVLVALGVSIGIVFNPRLGAPIGGGAAIILWLILLTTALVGGEDVILSSVRAKTIAKHDAPQLWNVVEEMTIAAGLPRMPRICIVDDDAPNAFAVGRKPEKSVVAVTSGLLKRLNRDELQGVVAHEIGHIQNLDIRFMTIATVMVGSIVMISDVFLRSLFYGAGRRRSSNGGGQAQIAMFVIAIAAAILAPIIARLLYFACSRQREYLADASAARFTRYPDGLASALKKIASKPPKSKEVNRALVPLYIVNPLMKLSAAGAFSTHPPTDKRIRILQSMGGRAGLADYESAYKKTFGKDAHCMGQQSLQSDESVEARPPTPTAVSNKQETIHRAREVTDLIDRLGGFLILPCACGLRIKIPPELNRDTITCPKCGRKNSLPNASRQDDRPFSYKRKQTGWESFRCPCGGRNQLSPNFNGDSIECVRCKKPVKIVAESESSRSPTSTTLE